jgi:hypothetical protein
MSGSATSPQTLRVFVAEINVPGETAVPALPADALHNHVFRTKITNDIFHRRKKAHEAHPRGRRARRPGVQQWLTLWHPSRIEKSAARRSRTSPARPLSQRREPETSLCVLIARRMEPERSGSSSQRPLGLSSRVAFCYLPACPCLSSSKGRLSDPGVPEIAASHPDHVKCR